jgi:hypothetical protein
MHLAYVEWYSLITSSGSKHGDGLWSISKSKDTRGQPMGAIVPLNQIRQTCMLTPDFSAKTLTSEKLDRWAKDPSLVSKECEKFRVNPYQSLHSFQTIYVD